jgi:hypothetical protein
MQHLGEGRPDDRWRQEGEPIGEFRAKETQRRESYPPSSAGGQHRYRLPGRAGGQRSDVCIERWERHLVEQCQSFRTPNIVADGPAASEALPEVAAGSDRAPVGIIGGVSEQPLEKHVAGKASMACTATDRIAAANGSGQACIHVWWLNRFITAELDGAQLSTSGTTSMCSTPRCSHPTKVAATVARDAKPDPGLSCADAVHQGTGPRALRQRRERMRTIHTTVVWFRPVEWMS